MQQHLYSYKTRDLVDTTFVNAENKSLSGFVSQNRGEHALIAAPGKKVRVLVRVIAHNATSTIW